MTPESLPDDRLRRLLAKARQVPPALSLTEARRLVQSAPTPPRGWTKVRRFFARNPLTTLLMIATFLFLSALLYRLAAPTPAPVRSAVTRQPATQPAPSDTTRHRTPRRALRPRRTRPVTPAAPAYVIDTSQTPVQLKPKRMRIEMTDSLGNVVNTYYVQIEPTSDSTADAMASTPVMPTPEAAAIRPDTATLAALGVQVVPGFTTFIHRIVGGGNLGIEYTPNRVGLGSYATSPTLTAIYPWFVTDLSGRETERYALPGEDTAKRQPAYFAQVLGRLVPVIVPVPTTDIPGRAVIFWYEATPAFLAVLPPTLAADVRCTYYPWLSAEARSPVATPGRSAPPVCPRPATPEAEFSLYPNPARATVNVRTTEQLAEAALLDLGGRELQRWTGTATTLPLPNVPPGLYLLRVRQQDGRVGTRRLLVE